MDAAYFRAKAAQCRRLLRSISDGRAIEVLTEMAKEFDAKAEEAEAAQMLQKAEPGNE
jgi:hypothetical protein